MGRIAILLFLAMASSAASCAESCAVTEGDLLGAWSRRGDSGFFEEFLLEKDAGERSFSSWLHQRPELFGAVWKLEDCRLSIEPQRGEFPPFRFKVLAFKQGRLRLYDESDHVESVYQRSRQAP